MLANGEPTEGEARRATPTVNALASEQDVLAADPSDYSVSTANKITVQALETLGHYADWLELPTQRLRDLNSLSFREAVVLGQTLTLDFARIDAPPSSSGAAPIISSCRAISSPPTRSRTSRAT